MTSSSLWDDNIVWGDSSQPTVNAIDFDLDTSSKSSYLDASYKTNASSRSKQDEPRVSSNSPKLVVSQQVRPGKKRSWFDWTVDSDDEPSHETDTSLKNPKQHEIRSQDTEASCNQKDAPSSFLPRLMLSISQLENEGYSAKEFKNISRRRSVECERPKSLSGSLKQFVRKVSAPSADEELDVPFPSRPREGSRRRSAW
jgi:hypothetical protein